TVLSARTFPYVPVRNMLFADSLIYVATTLGLSVYDTTMQLVHPPPGSLSNLKISKILNLNDTTLLLATIGNGIYVVNKRNWTFEKYNASDRLIADNIYSAEIKGDTLWLGTEKGILVGSVHLLAENNPRFVQFSSSHGLVEDKVDFLVLVNQKVWAFSDRGISVVPITSIYKKPSLPEFYFKKIYVDKKPISAGSTLFLPHDHTNVEMEYGFLSLRNQNITCRYRLSDNEPWTNTNERVIRFASLAPGNYALQIQYSIDNFHWHEADPPMQFVVHPPWWQRWYMHLLALVVTGFIIFIFLRHRYQRINRQQEELMRLELHTLERERNRIAKELHDGVATNLSAIRLMVNRLLRRYKDPLASEVDEHFLSTIKEIKSIIYGLTPSDLEREGLFKGLQHYVERLNRTLPFKIALQVSGDEVYAPGIGLLSFRIIQELLSNSVKHSGASNIYIRLESTPEKLNLMFQDDGVGFTYDDTRGHGLANVQSRIRSVNGSMKFESGPDLTTFIIDLPCR
ncbi:MAG TPA: ATP-binding protein, partial [Chryseosolibacter sp.]